MALTQSFYKEIFDKETEWITNLEHNLLNIYYLPELKEFYVNKYNQLLSEYELTGNEIIRVILNSISNMMYKLDYFVVQGKEGEVVDLKQLNNLFLINLLNNNIKDNQNLNRISKEKKNLYQLRDKVINSSSDDYLDDDFYYDKENKKVA